MISQRRFIFAAALILLVAAILRLTALSVIPPGLHYDEAANGVIVRNIAFGGYRPIFIPEYTGKEVLWFYNAALMMQILGPVIFALRLTSAFFGVTTVAATGWLVRQLYHDDVRRDYLALLSMAILAIAFWHGILSRFADRAITQPLLQALSLGLLWQGLRSTSRREQVRWLALAGIATGLAAYTYLAVRLFPLILAIIIIVFLITDSRRIERVPGLLAYVGAALVIFAPLGWYFIQHPEAFGTRIQQVAPTSQAQAVWGWLLALKMFFLSGDPLMRFNLPGKPLFGPVLALFFVLGLLVAWRDAFRERGKLTPTRGMLLIIWPIVMLAPTALAVGGYPPSNLRAVGLAPLIALYPALGIMQMSGVLQARDHFRQWRILVAPASLVLLLIGGMFTLRDLLRWGYGIAPEYALYYDNDGHVVSLARFLNDSAPDASTTYLATYHFRHPTLTFLAPSSAEARSLFGGGAVVISPSGNTLIAYTRDALPPTEWQTWLSDYQIAAPRGPDGTPDFYAYLLPKDIEAGLQPVPQANFGNIVELEAIRFLPASSGQAASIDAKLHILAPAPQPDYAFVAEVCDAYGWCWVKANLDGSLERGQNNVYNSTQWSPGERLLIRLEIPLPDGMPPGRYSVRMSIFSAQANQRLPLIDEANGFAGFYAEVSGLSIAASTNPDLANLPMQVHLGETVRPYVTLLGYDLPAQEARPGEHIDLALHWLSAGYQPGDANVTIQLGDNLVLYDGAPVHGTHPLTEWQPNELITDRYDLHLPVDLAAGIYPVVVRLGESAPIELGDVTVREMIRRFDAPPMATLGEPIVFGGEISLIGYNVPTHLTPGQPIDLMLVWQADTEVELRYTVFIHLLDASGNIIAQDDRQPFVAGQPYPTDLWLSGEIMPDVHTLNVPGDLPPGIYQIRLGLYLQDNGQRLSVPGTADNAVLLPITLDVP